MFSWLLANLELRNRWVAFAVAPDQLIAESWSELVRRNGCPCEVRGDAVPVLGISMQPVRLITLEGREEEARAILDRFVGRSEG